MLKKIQERLKLKRYELRTSTNNKDSAAHNPFGAAANKEQDRHEGDIITMPNRKFAKDARAHDGGDSPGAESKP
jgi:hypothetical protein